MMWWYSIRSSTTISPTGSSPRAGLHTGTRSVPPRGRAGRGGRVLRPTGPATGAGPGPGLLRRPAPSPGYRPGRDGAAATDRERNDGMSRPRDPNTTKTTPSTTLALACTASSGPLSRLDPEEGHQLRRSLTGPTCRCKRLTTLRSRRALVGPRESGDSVDSRILSVVAVRLSTGALAACLRITVLPARAG